MTISINILSKSLKISVTKSKKIKNNMVLGKSISEQRYKNYIFLYFDSNNFYVIGITKLEWKIVLQNYFNKKTEIYVES